MNEDQYHETIISFMQEVKMITGVRIFTKDEGLEQQIRSIKLFLRSSTRFNRLTRNELVHAFHLNSQGELDQVYRHYNRELNGEFIGDVLNAYLRYKNSIFKRDERNSILDALNKVPRKELPAPVLTVDDWKRMIQEDYEMFRAGQGDMIFNIKPKYCLLRKLGLIQFSSKRKWCEWYLRALRQRRLQYVIKPCDTRVQIEIKRLKLEYYAEIERTGVIDTSEHYSVIYTMQRLVYVEFFAILRDCAFVSIFRDIQEVYVYCRHCNRRNTFANTHCHHCQSHMHDH